MALIYFVETRASDQRQALCRWIEKFHGEGKKVQIVADSTMAAQHLDQLLWTFDEGSFIPHRILDSKSADSFVEPVIISIGEVRLEGFETLVCDGRVPLDFMKQYPVSVHFVLRDDEERKQESRLLWQAARDQGVKVQHVPLVSPMRRTSENR